MAGEEESEDLDDVNDCLTEALRLHAKDNWATCIVIGIGQNGDVISKETAGKYTTLIGALDMVKTGLAMEYNSLPATKDKTKAPSLN